MAYKFIYNDGGRKSSGFKENTSDCAVRAISIVTGLSYCEIYNKLSCNACTYRKSVLNKGRWIKIPSSFGNGVKHSVVKTFLESLGWKLTTFHSAKKFRPENLPKGKVLILLPKHITAKIKNEIHDIFDPFVFGPTWVFGYWKEEKFNITQSMDVVL